MGPGVLASKVVTSVGSAVEERATVADAEVKIMVGAVARAAVEEGVAAADQTLSQMAAITV